MASQQAPASFRFRYSMNRPPAQTPIATAQAQAQAQAQPPARQPRPPSVRPTLRPPLAQSQPQALAPPPPPPAPPVTASPPPPQPPSPVVAPPPATTSFPPSPIIKPSMPASPAPKVTSPPAATSFPPPPIIKPSLPTSPAPIVMSPPLPPPSQTTATVTTRAATAPSSPKIISPLQKTSHLSPKMEPFSTPPSPLVLPPAQIKFDNKPETKLPAKSNQKTMLVMQETTQKPKVLPDTSNEFYKTNSDSKDFGARVITIAGENRGAVMELSRSRQKHGKNGNPTAPMIDGENSKRDGDEERRSSKTTFMNSNAQCVNNSILLDCSINHHDPGVHSSLYRRTKGGRGALLKE